MVGCHVGCPLVVSGGLMSVEHWCQWGGGDGCVGQQVRDGGGDGRRAAGRWAARAATGGRVVVPAQGWSGVRRGRTGRQGQCRMRRHGSQGQRSLVDSGACGQGGASVSIMAGWVPKHPRAAGSGRQAWAVRGASVGFGLRCVRGGQAHRLSSFCATYRRGRSLVANLVLVAKAPP